MKKVFVSGCFDMIHSGHIEFFRKASKFGELYVCIGSDETIKNLKGKFPVNNQEERKFIIDSIKYVKKSIISQGSGQLDFKDELINIKPDFFIVNKDGDSDLKQNLCKKYKIEYIVLERIPKSTLPVRSSSELKKNITIPYRIDLAGGWLDQLYLNKFQSGPVITISIEPNHDFNERSGMATSTRKKAIELWGPKLPINELEKLSKILFSYENPPGTKVISGSQDSIGIIYPGINKLVYDNNYWPKNIESIYSEKNIQFIEENLYLIPLEPRVTQYDVLKNTKINKHDAKNLAIYSENTWESILDCKLENFGKNMLDSFKAQIKMFPNMINKDISKKINLYSDKCLGYKISGAGGGGYLILVSDRNIDEGFKIRIRRKNTY
jgi:cytidyltransferase-like protein